MAPVSANRPPKQKSVCTCTKTDELDKTLQEFRNQLPTNLCPGRSRASGENPDLKSKPSPCPGRAKRANEAVGTSDQGNLTESYPVSSESTRPGEFGSTVPTSPCPGRAKKTNEAVGTSDQSKLTDSYPVSSESTRPGESGSTVPTSPCPGRAKKANEAVGTSDQSKLTDSYPVSSESTRPAESGSTVPSLCPGRARKTNEAVGTSDQSKLTASYPVSSESTRPGESGSTVPTSRTTGQTTSSSSRPGARGQTRSAHPSKIGKVPSKQCNCRVKPPYFPYPPADEGLNSLSRASPSDGVRPYKCAKECRNYPKFIQGRATVTRDSRPRRSSQSTTRSTTTTSTYTTEPTTETTITASSTTASPSPGTSGTPGTPGSPQRRAIQCINYPKNLPTDPERRDQGTGNSVDTCDTKTCPSLVTTPTQSSSCPRSCSSSCNASSETPQKESKHKICKMLKPIACPDPRSRSADREPCQGRGPCQDCKLRSASSERLSQRKVHRRQSPAVSNQQSQQGIPREKRSKTSAGDSSYHTPRGSGIIEEDAGKKDDEAMLQRKIGETGQARESVQSSTGPSTFRSSEDEGLTCGGKPSDYCKSEQICPDGPEARNEDTCTGRPRTAEEKALSCAGTFPDGDDAICKEDNIPRDDKAKLGGELTPKMDYGKLMDNLKDFLFSPYCGKLLKALLLFLLGLKICSEAWFMVIPIHGWGAWRSPCSCFMCKHL